MPRDLNWHRSSLPKERIKASVHCSSTPMRALDRLLRDPLFVGVICPSGASFAILAENSKKRLPVAGAPAQARPACTPLLRAVLDIVVPKIDHGPE